MTTTYQTTGSLEHPVSDMSLAIAYLQQDSMRQYIYPEYLQQTVHSVEWTLTTPQDWKVTLVAHRELTPVEHKLLSEWISGQNSDGLGEGFEQQSWAEIDLDGDEDGEWAMASFDWQTNPCTLVPVT